jgi:diacylglycerol kinase (ATP)
MQVVLLFNPIAGMGQALRAADDIAASLRRRTWVPKPVATVPGDRNDALDDALSGASALVVLGGDGTMRQAAPFAVRHDVPVYHFPFGTENLFAREFEMTASVHHLLGVLERSRTRRVDVGEVDGALFLVMVSAGLDAHVVHELASERTGGITHFSYAAPLLRALQSWRPASLRIDVDGVLVDTAGAGITMVANLRQYALRLDPVPHARPDDGRLHLLHVPVRGKRDIPRVLTAMRLRQLAQLPDVTLRSGTAITLASEQPLCLQVDGDPCPVAAAPAAGTALRVRPGALKVLVAP